MEPTKKTNVKDLFLNLGAIVALYTVVISLINLLFAVINTAYPQITNGYNYYGSQSISWPVAILIIFFPIFVFLMWLLEKAYVSEPDRRNMGIRKWLSYITLFLAGIATAGDLVTVLYYFIDGQELTTGFLFKVLAVLVVALAVFVYYISDIRGKLNSNSRKIWAGVASVIILGSIVWGFSVLGSPRTQRLLKYDEQKVNDLMTINSLVQSYYQMKASMPSKMEDLTLVQYSQIPVDPQSGKAYEYNLIGQSAKAYELCAEFNIDSKTTKGVSASYPYQDISRVHPAGYYCFKLAIPVGQYVKLPM
ncbi:MAG: hypothetical protein AB201_01660 [Parcubacteria bacterium C7867-006]|nr:MAG: hypothetical protein AB201_01660 [Parcubacteria bacterium C7867-006]